MNNADYWIKHLKLIPHPEGGYYKETYKSQIFLSKGELNNCAITRSSASLIYFLLSKNEKSFFHKLKSDEIWIFNKGSSVNIYIIDKNGNLSIEKLGCDIENNEELQVFIPAESWFAAELLDKSSFCLMSCLVSPGFEWDDFELADLSKLMELYPEYIDILSIFL